MLTHLTIRNFIIIEQLKLEFDLGLIVITGETGSGKSIIIGALSLLLGSKTDSSVVGQFNEKCSLCASFDLKNIAGAIEWLHDNELNTDDKDECIIRRVINKNGKSKQMINGINCTLQQLRELAALLLNLHGQHQHQHLTKRSYQRELLDNFSQHLELCEFVRDSYLQWLANQNQIERLTQLQRNASIQRDLLQYQLAEFEKLAISPDEYEQLNAEHKILANRDLLIQNCQMALEKLFEREQSAQGFLYQAQSKISSIAHFDQRLQAANDLLNNSIIYLEEAITELRDYAHQIESNPERLNYIESRLSILHELARKHRVAPGELNQVYLKLKNELEQYQDLEHQLEQLNQKSIQLTDQYRQAATMLTESRRQAAMKLQDKISQKMQLLGMPGSVFKIDFSLSTQFSPHGAEDIEFLVAINPGQPLQPLAKVASGGEISRIALAIYVITAQTKTTAILVFDEVDVGIGGGTAAIVGKLLQSISQSTQVLCITHLPQVAVYGQQHLCVKKLIGNNQTTTTIIPLNEYERIQEIARMLGGLKITENTLAHARELIANCSAILAEESVLRFS